MSEKKEETKTAVKVIAAAVKTEERAAVIYIGPSIKNVVSTNTIYKNGLPEVLKQEKEKQPAIGSLIVPVNKLADSQKELNTPGSALALIYEKIAAK